MAAMKKTSITIPQIMLDEASRVAQDLKISRNQLIQRAVEQFIRSHHSQTPTDATKIATAVPTTVHSRVVNQGDIFWVLLENSGEVGIRHPYVIIQDNLINHSRIQSVAACTLTSNIQRASIPGNVLLEAGEANLPRQSVVEVSKVSAIDKNQLGEYIGTLTAQRINQILAGLRFLELAFFADRSEGHP